jgi:hypothetical protein
VNGRFTNTAPASPPPNNTDSLSEGSTNLYYTEARVSANTNVAANTLKVSFPGFGTTAGTSLEGNTPLLQLGTSGTTALAGNTTTISTAQANAITANTAKIATVADDTSPQLGGNLDVNGNDIVSASDGNIELDPDGSGQVVFKGNSTKGSGQFVLNCEQNSHGVVLKGPPHSANASYTLTLPNTDGSANQVLKTDGSGNLDWVDQTTDTNTTDLVSDTSPQLGGDLDLNGNKITTTSNADILIEPDGTGDINLSADTINLSDNANTGRIVIGTNFIQLKSTTVGAIWTATTNSNKFQIQQPLALGTAAPTSTTLLGIKRDSRTHIICENAAGDDKFKVDVDSSGNATTTIADTFIASGLTYPTSDGTNGQVLTTNGSGTLSFTTVSGGSGSSTFLGLTDTPSSFTASKFLKVNSAGNAVEFVDNPSGGISDVVDDTTPQLGGNLDTNGSNIVFGDSATPGTDDTLIFGAGNDLQIYHDGNDSFIKDAGTGDLKINASTVKISDHDGSPTHITVSGTGLSLNSGNGLVNVGNDKVGNGTDEEYIKFDDSANTVSLHVEDVAVFTVGDNHSTGNGFAEVTGKLEVTKGITLDKTANTDFSYRGDVMYFGSGSTTQGELCYLNSSGGWTAADADATGTAGGVMLAIALGTDPDADGMLLRGTFTLDHDPGTIGDELYVSTTAGDITATAPSGTGDVVRVVGYCLDSTNGQIWFNPSNDFIVLA